MEKNLKAKVKLLQDKAPKNHFLAYINADEANLLKEMGGSGEMTPQGIISFRPQDYGDQAKGTGAYSGGSPGNTGSQSNSTGGSTDNDNSDNSSNNTPYRDPIMDMVDPAKIPGTPEYIEEEKTDYVTLPEKKLKLSKGVRPEMTVTLEQKKYYDRLDAQVDKVVKSPGYQIEKRLVNFALNKIPIIGMFLPEYYPKRTIAGDTVGSQDIPMDRPEQRSDYKSASSMLGSTDYLLGNIINTDLINDAIPDVFNNLPDSMVNKYFDGTTDGAFSESYNEIKSRLENQISTSQNGKVHKDNIFYDYLEKEGLING